MSLLAVACARRCVASSLLQHTWRLANCFTLPRRWEVLGQYSVGLMLDEGLSGGAETEPKLHMFVERPSGHRFFSGRVRCSGTGGWERFECTVEQCPKGFRRALVMLRGRVAPGTVPAASPLPRFSGTKFACAELVFAYGGGHDVGLGSQGAESRVAGTRQAVIRATWARPDGVQGKGCRRVMPSAALFEGILERFVVVRCRVCGCWVAAVVVGYLCQAGGAGVPGVPGVLAYI